MKLSVLIESKSKRELHERVRVEAERIYEVLREKFPAYSFQFPELDFSLKGRTAGKAWFRPMGNHKIQINQHLLENYTEDMIGDTLPHEIAHLATYRIYGTHVSAHGPEWRRVARILGCTGERCHNYKTKPARKTKKFRYKCACSDNHLVGLNVHKKMLRGQERFCRSCKCGITFVERAR